MMSPAMICSQKYLPSTPLELPTPAGHSSLAEFSRMRVDSRHPAPSTMTLPKTSSGWRVRRSTNSTLFAFPSLPVRTFQATALVRKVRLPVFSAMGSRTPDELNEAETLQTRPQWPQ